MTDEKKTIEGDSSIVYAYHYAAPIDKVFVDKFLEVFFDPQGVVKDVDLDVSQSTNGSVGPALRVDGE